MIDNIYDKSTINTVDGIDIYTGTTEFSKLKVDSNITYYKNLVSDEKTIFTDLVPSTITIKGVFNNIQFNEEHIIGMLSEPSGGYILKICCNYGVLLNKTPLYIKPPAKVRVSNRGRKPKIKKLSKRKLQGSGKYFSSQITFEIYNPESEKIYKIKLFRNGGFQVPGINRPDITDLINPIKELEKYLQTEFLDETIKAKYFISVMRNYICRLKDKDLLIRLNELEILFKSQKDDDEDNPRYELMDDISKKLNLYNPNEIKNYIGKKHNSIGIAEIQNNCERYFGLILKFYRPVSWKLEKRTTVKVLRSGKINIDGANNIEDAYVLYHWLEHIFIQYKNSIFFDKNKESSDSSEYDVGDNVAIYDD
jgi:hypothetical protein